MFVEGSSAASASVAVTNAAALRKYPSTSLSSVRIAKVCRSMRRDIRKAGIRNLSECVWRLASTPRANFERDCHRTEAPRCNRSPPVKRVLVSSCRSDDQERLWPSISLHAIQVPQHAKFLPGMSLSQPRLWQGIPPTRCRRRCSSAEWSIHVVRRFRSLAPMRYWKSDRNQCRLWRQRRISYTSRYVNSRRRSWWQSPHGQMRSFGKRVPPTKCLSSLPPANSAAQGVEQQVDKVGLEIP